MAKKKAVVAKTQVKSGSYLTGAPPQMRPQIVVFLLESMSPLLQNNPACMEKKDEEPEEPVKKGTKKKTKSSLSSSVKDYDDVHEAKIRAYLIDGVYCHPAESVTKAMIKAVPRMKFGKLTATSALKGSVFLTEDFAVIEDRKGKPIKEYDIDKRSVVIKSTGGRVNRCRPVWPEWQLKVPLEIDTAILPPEYVLDALQLAGRTVGIGDFRPEKSGRFGRFTASILR